MKNADINWILIFCRYTQNRAANQMKQPTLLSIFALTVIVTFTSKHCLGQSESQLRVGKAINVLIRYGYLSISMKVISYNDTEKWLFKEPTKNIFQVSPGAIKLKIGLLHWMYHASFEPNKL